VGKKDGPRAAITLLHELEQHRALENYYLLYASLGEFYCQIGDPVNATDYFLRAKNLARSPAIRDLLDRKLANSQKSPDPDRLSP
jgi:predicted RNA polymerase sigma factor